MAIWILRHDERYTFLIHFFYYTSHLRLKKLIHMRQLTPWKVIIRRTRDRTNNAAATDLGGLAGKQIRYIHVRYASTGKIHVRYASHVEGKCSAATLSTIVLDGISTQRKCES